MNIKMMLGASVFIIDSSHKNFHSSVHWTCLRSNKPTHSLFFTIRYYKGSDIEFDTVTKTQLKKFEEAVGLIKTLSGLQFRHLCFSTFSC